VAPATGADLHHRVRHEWLDRLRQLRLRADDLHSDGRFDLELPHNGIVEMFGCQLLFEVEAFRADELSSPEEARILLEECADIALATATSGLEQSRAMRRHPDWLPDLTEALRGLHRDTIAVMEATTDVPIPPYRWRLPTEVHAAAWDALGRRWPSYRRGFSSASSTEYEDLVSELRARGVHRVLVLHQPAIAQFSCETDVTLLADRRHDWPDATGQEGQLTCDTFDWVVDVEMYGLWHAYGWA
jgi:hypothetical protein